MKTKLLGLVALVGSLLAVAGTASAHEREWNRERDFGRFEMQRHERERELGRRRGEWRRERFGRFRREVRYYPSYRVW